MQQGHEGKGASSFLGVLVKVVFDCALECVLQAGRQQQQAYPATHRIMRNLGYYVSFRATKPVKLLHINLYCVMKELVFRVVKQR